jgi:hypothetical protein
MRYLLRRKWRPILLCLALLLLMLSGPRNIAVFVALTMPLLVPVLVLFGISYRIRRKWRR